MMMGNMMGGGPPKYEFTEEEADGTDLEVMGNTVDPKCYLVFRYCGG